MKGPSVTLLLTFLPSLPPLAPPWSTCWAEASMKNLFCKEKPPGNTPLPWDGKTVPPPQFLKISACLENTALLGLAEVYPWADLGTCRWAQGHRVWVRVRQGKALKKSLFFILWNITSLLQFINSQFLIRTLGTVWSYKSLYLWRTNIFFRGFI